MRGKGKCLVTVLTAVVWAAALPAAGQQRPQSSQVTLIARMPETVTFAVNSGEPGDFSSVGQIDNRQIATSITTSWVLGKGRARMVTMAHVKRPDAPTLLAFAMPSGIGVIERPELGGLPGIHLPTHPAISSFQLDSLAITEGNRVANTTVSLSDSLDASFATQTPEGTYIGTVNIQIQALP